MGKYMDENIEGRVKGYIFNDSYKEVVKFYSDKYDVQQWEDAGTLVICDTGTDVGLFEKSDIIAVYDSKTFLPTIITERVFRSNYSFWDWIGIRRMLRLKCKYVKEELGFSIRVTYARDYIDYIHYKEEWWQWAIKRTLD